MSTCFSRVAFPCLAVSLNTFPFLYVESKLIISITVNTMNAYYVAKAIDDVVRTVV